jgi:NAD(P)-dependent dehydrogenase (short-subunit alcohol dehydrogenase family)
MDLGLGGKTALISGGSKGIGRAAAAALAAEGVGVTLVARSPEGLAAAAAEIRARFQDPVATIAADLSRQDEVERVAAAVPTPDILVNNAGAIPPGALAAVDDAAWRAAWDLKVFGYISLSRAIHTRMTARGSGVIVNVIGAAGEKFDPDYIAGSAGNAALMAFTRALGRASPAHGVRVVGINPGPVETERLVMLQRARAGRSFGDPERWREFFARMPFGRPATPEEIGAAVAFLASPRSAYTNATILTIDGGG